LRIETNRLILKDYSIENIQDYYLLKSCEVVWKYSTYKAITDINLIRNQLNELIINQEKSNIGFHAIFEKASNNYIGEAGILSINITANRCVIGYNLLPSFWNLGYATEITTALVQYAFHVLEFERVEAIAMQLNTAIFMTIHL
jgi:ribosomal-protein-alanine N-acetyltransferase